MIRIVGQPELHHFAGSSATDARIAWTRCGIRYLPGEWPKALARPALLRCGPCRG